MGAHDTLVEISGHLNVLAVSLVKVANYIRLLGSGPRCGLGELIIPDDGLTSSIMPGKRNATIGEVVVQAGLQVMGNHVDGGRSRRHVRAQRSQPVLIYNLLQSIRLLGDAAHVLAAKLVTGLEVDRKRLAANVEQALLLATALNPVLGYDRVAEITARALRDETTPRAAAVALGLLTGEDYDRLVDATSMASPR